ncbi:MAG TPA: diphthine--ammonia ligase [archaeon]|nr:diphthine--ammonia ligase [archaeon]
MKLGVLFSGGKDSTFAMYKAMHGNDVVCLISMLSENNESYMFHTPNISLVRLQAEAIGLPLVQASTKGEKEKELKDLKRAISLARQEFGLEGIVTGAVASVYQYERIGNICKELGLECVNPLWKREQVGLLEELLKSEFKVIISGVFAYPLGKDWLGREMDKRMIKELAGLQEKYKINPSGEGGEIETTVLDCPLFKKRLKILEAEKVWKGDSGIYSIKKAELAGK